jgi:hypothetical protein
MERTPYRKNDPKLTCVQAEKATGIPNDNFRLRGQVDDLCITLFDRWCERRELTPLVYLLYAWPFFPSTSQAVETVSATLRELLIFHAEALDDLDRRLIRDIHALAGC